MGDITLFPNPTTDLVNLNFPEVTQGTIVIDDIKGLVIKTKTFNSNNTAIDISNLASGSYFATVIINNTKKTFKILKE